VENLKNQKVKNIIENREVKNIIKGLKVKKLGNPNLYRFIKLS
jgi:hypothetical protein